MINLVSVDAIDMVSKLESSLPGASRLFNMAFRLAIKNSVDPIATRQQSKSGYIMKSLANLFTFTWYGVSFSAKERYPDEIIDIPVSKLAMPSSSTYHGIGDPMIDGPGECSTVAAPVNSGEVLKLSKSSISASGDSSVTVWYLFAKSVNKDPTRDNIVDDVNRIIKKLSKFIKLVSYSCNEV